MPFIPFKSNTLESTKAGTWAWMYHLFMYRREKYIEHYHKRSNIETTYSMIEGKFGSALHSKSSTGQINEALCKVLAHNICVLIQAMHALNIHPIFSAATQPAPKRPFRATYDAKPKSVFCTRLLPAKIRECTIGAGARY